MKIKEFDAKVRIGSWVLYRGKPCRVEDIDRREHAVYIRKWKKVRCSEIIFLGNDLNETVK